MNETTRIGLGSQNYIVGTVFSPYGYPISVRMNVRLVSSARGDVLTTTDDRGQFVFSGVTEGSYTVQIDADRDFETSSQQVEVLRSRGAGAQSYTLTIRLIAKRSPMAKPSIINSNGVATSKTAKSLYNSALELKSKGEHRSAIEKLKLALAESPTFLNALNELGSECMIVGDLTQAEESLRAALKIDPSAAEPLTNFGILMFRSKNYDAAEKALLKVIEGNESQAVAHFYLGRIYMATNKPEEALKELNITVQIGGDLFKEAHRLLSILYLDRGDHAKVVDELETYLRLVPEAKDASDLRLIIKQNKAVLNKP